ncbi:MAG: ureD [Frankiales bacterium]|nr:ureD [Frankiales bacterium]
MSLTGAAHAVAQQDGARLRWTTLRSQVPFSLRPTAGGLTLVASAFGPLGGDRTRVRVELGPGVEATVGSAGAQVAQPGVHDAVSHAAVVLSVAPGARLSWRPEPVVVTEGAHHVQDLDVTLEDGAEALLVETAVLGRTGQGPGRLTTRWRVTHAGSPLLASDLDVGPGAPDGWDAGAVLGGARVLVSALAVGRGLPEEALRVAGGEVLRLAGPGLLLTWQGDDPVAARRAVAAFARSVRTDRTASARAFPP